jgi:hypothetical protein
LERGSLLPFSSSELARGQKVMLSMVLPELYEVAPRVLVQAVKRNIQRFPQDFTFQLTRQERADLKSQIVAPSWAGARRATPPRKTSTASF